LDLVYTSGACPDGEAKLARPARRVKFGCQALDFARFSLGMFIKKVDSGLGVLSVGGAKLTF
jgi:hypothetical protein